MPCCTLTLQPNPRCSAVCIDFSSTQKRIKHGVGKESSLVLAERTAVTNVKNPKNASYDRVLRARRCMC